MTKPNIVVAVTGASGSAYARIFINDLATITHSIGNVALVFSEKAKQVWDHEIGPFNAKDFPFKVYDNNDFYASFASGSSSYNAMVIIPCSMGTIGRIASGHADNLIERAADVMLKERRKLILVAREAPYNLIHLRNLVSLTETGAIIYPASPSFYSKPQTPNDILRTVTSRIFSLLDLPGSNFSWGK